jgi:hypothetical protein
MDRLLFNSLSVGLALGLSLGTVGCTCPADQPRASSRPLEDFENRLVDIAQEYESYGRIDPVMRWAPTDCRAPGPPHPVFSESKDSGTHGQKLYSLFVKQRPKGFSSSGEYTLGKQPNPIGQVVVKEAWLAEEMTDESQQLEPVIRKIRVRRGDAFEEYVDRFFPYARKDGQLYRAGQKASLFIMFKLDPKTPATDNGWVYGTVSADGKQVTSAGRLESCMNCHLQAAHDRLFGWSKN